MEPHCLINVVVRHSCDCRGPRVGCEACSVYLVCAYCDKRDASVNFTNLAPIPADEPCPMRNSDGCKVLARPVGATSYGPGAPGCELDRGHHGDHRLGSTTWRNLNCPMQQAGDLRAATGNYTGYRTGETINDLAWLQELHAGRRAGGSR